MTASIIICTHNPRDEYLRRVLDGLRHQTLPTDQWELLLIDNRSNESLAERFDLSWHVNAKHLREEELGLTTARLRGISESSADILVFVDDDTVLAPNYLEEALKIGTEWSFVGAWGGSAIGEPESPIPSWLGDQRWRLTIFEVQEDVWSNLRDGFTTVPVGAGMCVRSSVARHFAERSRDDEKRKALGRKGAELMGYEDAELAHCALDLGLGTGRSTRLRLTHLIPNSRLTLDYFIRHAEGDAASLMMFRALRGLPIQEPKPLSAFARFRWKIHRLINRIPGEYMQIQEAHHRGAIRGYERASKYLAAKARS